MIKRSDDADVSLHINPYYAVSIQDGVFRGQQNKSAREDWLLLNTILIDEIGIEVWLNQLLDALTLNDDDYDGHDIVRPNLTIQLSRNFAGVHEPLVTRDEWVEVNAKLTQEIGAHTWLSKLLDVLEN